MAFDLCVIPASVVPYLSALQTRKFSITDITAHLVSEKLTREQCRLMTPDTFASSYGSSSHASHALHVRSSVSSEINLAITSSVSGNAPSGYTIVIQGYLNDHNSHIVLGVCVSDEPIVADASLRMFVNIEETNNVFRLRADFDGMVTQGLLDDILYQSLEAYPTIALYNSSTKKITFKNASNTELPNMEIDASAFIKDGMVKDVVIQNENLVVSFNTDAGKEDISIPLSSIFDPSNYYTKTQIDTQISNAIGALGESADKNVDTSIVNASSGNLPTVEAVTGWVSSQLSGYAQSRDIPTVGNATITIQKRSGTSAGNFTTNATADKTINLSLGAAADKEVDTSIASTSSTNLPTSSAVAEWVNAQIGNFVTLDTQQTITSPKTLSSGEFSTSFNISNIVVEQVPSSTSGHTSSATLASDGLYADGVSFKNAYGRAADNFLVASVSGNGGYSELTVLGGQGFTFSYKGTNETDNHYPLRISAGSTTFDENQTLYLAKDTNTYLHVDNTNLSVKDYVKRIADSGSSKFVVAGGNTLYPTQISNLTDKRPAYSQSGTSSDNPHYNSNNASFKFDVSELPSNGTTFEVYFEFTSFVGSVQLVYGSLNYIYPIYFRGNDNVHCPTVPKGSVLRITFYNDAFYGDFYDLADFGDEHEAYVYVGKVPVDKSDPDLLAFSGLVGIDRDTGKFSQLFTVSVTDNGAGVISPRLKENSPIYACFQGDCFAAHPKVPFGNILRIYDKFYSQGTLYTNMLPFTYYPFDNGDTVDAHVVTNTSSHSQGTYKYFQVDNCPVYIQVESNRVLLGNPPADIPARLIGFMCSGAENAGMIRLVESADVSYMSDNEYSKTFAGVWDDNSVDSDKYKLSHVDTGLSYLSDNVLVGLSKNSSKLVPLLVDDACNGDVTINTNLDWDSPVYVLFKNFRCFSAHPMVDFRQVLKYDNDRFMFTFSPMGSVGSEAPSVAVGDDGNQYFGSANYPVFISDFHGSYSGYKSFCVGIPSDVNIPSSDLHWRLLGYTTSTPGYIRLTESHPFLKDFIHQTGGYVKLSKFTDTFNDSSIGDRVTASQYVEHFKAADGLQVAVQKLVSNHGESVFHIKDLDASPVYGQEQDGEVYVYLPHMTTIEFNNRVSFRKSADEVAYIDRDGVYHGRATGISSDLSLSFSEATSGTTGGTLSVSVGDRTSSSVAISPVRCARQPYVSSHNSNGSYPLVFTSDVDEGYKDLYTDTVNSLSYNPNSNTLTCPTFVGDLTGNADTATRATEDASGNTITSYYCTLSTAQTVSGSKTFSGKSEFTGDVYVTGYGYGGLRFADTDSLQKTDYVRVRGSCSSSSNSGIDVQFYVDSSIRHSLSLKETKHTSDSYDLSITPSASNICTLGSPNKKMKAIYATTYYGLAEQLFGTGVGSLYLLKFKAVNTSTSHAIFSRGNFLQSIPSCTISDVRYVTVFNGSGSTISTTDSSGYCLYMWDGDGVNGVFRLLNSIAIPRSSTRYLLALVVRIS